MFKLKNIFFLFIVSCTLFGCTLPYHFLIDNDFLKKIAINNKEHEYARIWVSNVYGVYFILSISFNTNDSLIVIPSSVSVYCNREKLSKVDFYNFNRQKQESPLIISEDNKNQYVEFVFSITEYRRNHLNEIRSNSLYSSTKDTIIIDLNNVIWRNNNPVETEKLIITQPMLGNMEYKEKMKYLKQEIKNIH